MAMTEHSSEMARKLVRRFWEEVFNHGDAGAVADVVSTGYKLDDLSTGAMLNRTNLTELVDGLHDNLSGSEAEIIELLVAEGDRVVTRLVFRALPIDAEGDYSDPVEINAITIDRIVDGRVESTQLMWDAWTADVKLRPENADILDWRFPWW